MRNLDDGAELGADRVPGIEETEVTEAIGAARRPARKFARRRRAVYGGGNESREPLHLRHFGGCIFSVAP